MEYHDIQVCSKVTSCKLSRHNTSGHIWYIDS